MTTVQSRPEARGRNRDRCLFKGHRPRGWFGRFLHTGSGHVDARTGEACPGTEERLRPVRAPKLNPCHRRYRRIPTHTGVTGSVTKRRRHGTVSSKHQGEEHLRNWWLHCVNGAKPAELPVIQSTNLSLSSICKPPKRSASTSHPVCCWLPTR